MRVKSRLLLVLVCVLAMTAGFGAARWFRKLSTMAMARPKTFAAIEKVWKEQEEKARGPRRIAQAPVASPARCLKDRLEPAVLASDIKQAEAAYGGDPGPGKIGDVSLGTVPKAQLDYLAIARKTSDDSVEKKSYLIQLEGVDHAGCQSVVCMINRVYGKPDGDVTGMMVYDFYLRTGYVLNVSSRVLDYTSADYLSTSGGTALASAPVLADFLWSTEELKALWIVAHSYPAGALHAPSANRIYRMPRKTAIPKYPSPVCGLASSSSYSGVSAGRRVVTAFVPMHIQVTDECLTLGNYPRVFGGFFYDGVPHEMGHHVDYSTNLNNTERVSESSAWRDLSGWVIEERVQDGRTIRTWNYTQGAEFPSSYAGTSPAEDFADSIAFTRYRGPMAVTKIPKKSRFISDRFFAGRTFDEAGLIASYSDQAGRALLQVAPTFVSGCVRAPSDVPSGSDSLGIDMPARISAPIAACLQARLGLELRRQLDQIRTSEWEACDLVDQKYTEIKQKVAQSIGPTLGPVLESNADLAALQAASEALRTELKAKIDAREIWLGCKTDSKPQPCFEQAISVAFDGVASACSAELGAQLEVERKLFMAANSYDEVARQVETFFRQLLGDSTHIAQEYGKRRWQACVEGQPPTRQAGTLPSPSESAAPGEDPTIPPTLPFTGGETYIAGYVLSCINVGFDADAHAVRDEWARARRLFQVSDPGAQQYILEFLSKEYLATLKLLAAQQAKDEGVAREPAHQEAVLAISETLAGNAGWVANSTTIDSAKALCPAASVAQFDLWLARRSTSNPVPVVFEAVENLRTRWSSEACDRAMADARVIQKVDQNRAAAEALEWNTALKRLEGFASKRADTYGVSCRRQYVSLSGRSSCMRNAWPQVETQALADWDRTNDGVRFRSRRRDAQTYLHRSDVRIRLQDDAIRRMNTGT